MIIDALGLDNIAVGFALGPLRIGARRTALLGLSFAVAEAGMTLLGSRFAAAWLPKFLGLDAARAGVLATLGVAVLGLAWIKARPATFVGNPWALIVLTLLLSIDNLIAGASHDVAVLPPLVIVVSGAVTGILAIAACATAGLMFRAAPQWGARAAGVMLVGLAVAGIG
jgi:manganese efflux pump family protein